MEIHHQLETGLSIVIPVYNSQDSLELLVQELLKTLPDLCKPFEIILVDDGSRDGSWTVLSGLTKQSEFVTAVALMRNYGQHNALLCGIRMASFDTVVTMDDDLQHPPSEIKKLLAKLDEGYDVVYGYPEAEQHGLWRDLASQITKIVLRNIMGIGPARHVGAFRAFTTRLRHAFEGYRGPFVSIDVLLTWGTSRFAAIPVRHELRQHGKSNYTFGKLVTHAFNMMTGFSTIPLQIASYTGFAFTAFGGVVLIYVLLCTLINRTAPSGWPFLASIIAIFSGVQMFSLGIIGEYLARMHFRMMDRPPYAIYGVINPPPEHE